MTFIAAGASRLAERSERSGGHAGFFGLAQRQADVEDPQSSDEAGGLRSEQRAFQAAQGNRQVGAEGGPRRVVAEVELPGRLDPKTGWLELERIPVQSTNKFGATVSTQSARIAVGSDRALYVQMNSTDAGIVLFMPAFGTGTIWGRWEPSAP